MVTFGTKNTQKHQQPVLTNTCWRTHIGLTETSDKFALDNVVSSYANVIRQDELKRGLRLKLTF